MTPLLFFDMLKQPNFHKNQMKKPNKQEDQYETFIFTHKKTKKLILRKSVPKKKKKPLKQKY